MPQIGETIGHYRIDARLGAGGMGVVYLAEDQQLGRKVALKFLAPQLLEHPEGLRRFKNEALAAAELSHPNLATVYDVTLGPDEYYLAMEYLDGEDLAQRVRRGVLEINEILHVMKEATQGLVHAHERGVIHRDIKSGNIFVTGDNQVKILDFGLAHRIDATRITREGSTLGTIGYMSPEQVKGQPADVRSDIWSLGVVLYECATGHLPFEAESFVAVSNLICSGEPLAPSSLRADFPHELEGVIQRCLQKDVQLRFQHADEVLAELLRTERSLFPDSAVRAPFLLRVPRWMRELWRRRVVHAGAAYALIALLLVFAVGHTVQRLHLSSELNEIARYCIALLAPSALFMSWRRGGPWAGRRPWKLPDLSALPASLLFLTLFLLVNFRGKPLGAVEAAVSVPDAAGVLSARVIPKPQFRKHLSTFYFENASGDSGLDWLSYGLHDLISTDLSQDMFVELRGPLLERDRLLDDGYADPVALPRPYARDLARRRNSDHFLTGRFEKRGETLIVSTALHDTERGRLVAERRFEGEDALVLVDEVSIQLRRDLGIPAWQIEESEDLPIADMESESLPAITLATEAMQSLYFRHDPEEATSKLEQAVRLDPSYAAAHLLSYIAWNNPDHPQFDRNRAAQALESTLKFLYRFSERQRLAVQSTAALVQADLEACLNINRARALLYPDDPQAHEMLGRILAIRGDRQGALTELGKSLSLDPHRAELLLRIGQLQIDSALPERALESFGRYSSARPNDARGPGSSAEVLLSLGRLAEAEAAAARASVLDPTEMRWQLLPGAIAEGKGAFAEAEEIYRRALASSSSLEDSLAVHASWASLLRTEGRLDDALLHAARERDGRERQRDAAGAVALDFEITRLKAARGERAQAQRRLQVLAASCTESLRGICLLGSIAVLLELGEFDTATRQIAELEAELTLLSEENLPWLELLAARVAMAVSDWRSAAERLEQLRARQLPSQIELELLVDLARCHRESGDLAQARSIAEAALARRPAWPEAQLELAQILDALGDAAGARANLSFARAAWSRAEPGYRPLSQALALQRKLESR